MQSPAVIAGDLLGLKASKAVADMKVESYIIKFSSILMCRQVATVATETPCLSLPHGQILVLTTPSPFLLL